MQFNGTTFGFLLLISLRLISYNARKFGAASKQYPLSSIFFRSGSKTAAQDGAQLM